jgi:para-nitrobenzyl esterase
MRTFFFAFLLVFSKFSTYAHPADSVRVESKNGPIEGFSESGIMVFKGIPFAQPPVGKLRWREPQPVKSWSKVLKAYEFSARPMQNPVFKDMVFRSDKMSEDCLYLNVWAPIKYSKKPLPVFVYFYGGGFQAGDGSEPRYDGESMARRGIVYVTVNYRLNIFGFFAHPELSKESLQHSSGNYGLMDQAAALKWISKNISAFGGDSAKITIGGESAGSIACSAQMASPLSRNLIAGVIGESGSLLGALPAVPLSKAEKTGLEFCGSLGVSSVSDLRSTDASQLLAAITRFNSFRFAMTVDGYFFPKSPYQIYESAEQAKVPLLAGWNSEEMGYYGILADAVPTKENYIAAVQKLYGEKAAEILELYSASSDEQVQQVATQLAGDRFVGYSTWKWSDVHARTSGKPVYRYYYSHPRPFKREEIIKTEHNAGGEKNRNKISPFQGAVHSAEIEYALGNLPTNSVYDWRPEDYRISEIMQTFFVNFIKTGSPNGVGLPTWTPVKPGVPASVMIIDSNTRVEIEKVRERYLLLDRLNARNP